ncbi:LSM domain-containing protein [Purpureocillium lilacinum]|uniref:LSM domain-containing protein n=1 Tax=Purpureocillium lilacinum TaxID=33203 RepID=A0A2U3EFL7_PURLI|nr:LSM domain-containing protein [Purpureocillium lilacinum]
MTTDRGVHRPDFMFTLRITSEDAYIDEKRANGRDLAFPVNVEFTLSQVVSKLGVRSRLGRERGTSNELVCKAHGGEQDCRDQGQGRFVLFSQEEAMDFSRVKVGRRQRRRFVGVFNASAVPADNYVQWRTGPRRSLEIDSSFEATQSETLDVHKARAAKVICRERRGYSHNVKDSALRLLSCAHIRPIKPLRSFAMAPELCLDSPQVHVTYVRAALDLIISVADNLLISMLRHRREYSILTPSVRPVTVTPAQAVRCHDSQEVRNTDSGTNVYAVSRDQGLLVAPQCRRPEPCPAPRLVAFSSLSIARSCHVGSGRAAEPRPTVYHGSDHAANFISLLERHHYDQFLVPPHPRIPGLRTPPPRHRPPSPSPIMDKDEAQAYLQSLLNKNLRITTTDGRLFWGSFKCTDPDSNVVLAHTYEYRQPSDERVRRHLAEEAAEGTTVALDMTSRYLGLIVVPGHHIAKMELEQFASQLPR